MKNKIAWAGAFALVSFVTIEFGVIGVLPEIADSYHIEIKDAGYLLSGFAIVVALAGPFVTALTGGINRRTLMLTGIFLFLISALVPLMSPPFWLMLIVRILPAFFHSTLISIAVHAASKDVPLEKKHQIMSIVIGGVAIATISTIPLATYLAGRFDSWKISYIFQSIISLAALILISKTYPTMPVLERKNINSQLSILATPVFIWSSIATLLMNATMFTTYSYFAEYLKNQLHINNPHIGTLMLVFGFSGILGNTLTGKMLSKNVTYTMAFFVIGLCATTFLLTSIDSQTSIPLVYLVIAIWGFCHTPCFVNGQAYMIEVAAEAPELANSVSISFGNLGISLGTFVSGLYISNYGIAVSPWVMLGAAILTLIAMMIKHFIQKKRKNEN